MIGLAVPCVLLTACGKQGGGTPTSAVSPPASATSDATEPREPTLADALDALAAGRAAEGVEIVRTIGTGPEWRKGLLAFDVLEAEYASWGDDERAARSPAILARATALQTLGRLLLDEARRRVVAGRADEGREILEVMQRLGEANGDPALVQMGRLAGDTITHQAKRELESLGAGSAAGPSS